MGRPKFRDPLAVYVGDALATVRKARGLTQKAIAVQLDVTTATICNYERGRSQLHLRQFIELCSVLNVNPADVITAALHDGAHLIGSSDPRELR